MRDKRSLNEKIIHSVFAYETTKLTLESLFKIAILTVSTITILIFGGLISDVFIENEMGVLFGDFIKAKEYSYTRILELSGTVLKEIPLPLIWFYLLGLAVGCILVVSIIKNRKLVWHTICSLVGYWFKS